MLMVVCLLVCEQGVVVDGVYKRDVLSPSQCRSPLASSDDYTSSMMSPAALGSCYLSFECHGERTSVIVTSSHSVATSASTSASTQCTSSQLSANDPASLCSTSLASQVAIQPPVPSSHVCSLSLASLKSGVLPPAANIDINTSSVVTDISCAHQQCLDKSAFQTDNAWKEFEEALSEEFVSSTVADSSHQTKGAISSACLLQPPKAPNLMMLSIASFHTLHLVILMCSHVCQLPMHVCLTQLHMYMYRCPCIVW